MLKFFLEDLENHSVFVANGNDFVNAREGMNMNSALSYARSISIRIGPAIVRRGNRNESPIVAIFRDGSEHESLSSIPELEEPPRDAEGFLILIKKFNKMRKMTNLCPQFLGDQPHRRVIYVLLSIVFLSVFLATGNILSGGDLLAIIQVYLR